MGAVEEDEVERTVGEARQDVVREADLERDSLARDAELGARRADARLLVGVGRDRDVLRARPGEDHRARSGARLERGHALAQLRLEPLECGPGETPVLVARAVNSRRRSAEPVGERRGHRAER